MNKTALAQELVAIARKLMDDEPADPEALARELTGIAKGLRSVAPDESAGLAGLSRMDLGQIARLIYDDHKAQGRQVNYAAKPYLQAMSGLKDIGDTYMADSGETIVAYLLGNLSGWGGETARAVKKELNRRLR